MILWFCVMSNNHHVSEKMYNVSNIQDRMGKRECGFFDLSPLSWIFSLPVLLPLLLVLLFPSLSPSLLLRLNPGVNVPSFLLSFAYLNLTIGQFFGIMET